LGKIVKKYLFTCVCLLLAVGACSIVDTVPTFTAAPLKLYVFDCGGIRLDTVTAFSVSDEETEVRKLAVPCYVIEHGRRRLLWDGGLPSRTAETEGWQGQGLQIRLERTLSEQLAAINLDMSSFDFMAFSHMHFDHVGVANEVEGATLLIQQAEYDAGFADPVEIPGADPSLYNKLADAQKVLLNGDHDVFGDGRVRIVSAPGHTPGHQVLFIDLAVTGPLVLSGDLYHFAISRELKRVPSFNHDAEATKASMDHVEEIIAETGSKLWIQHELALFEQLKKVPLHYE